MNWLKLIISIITIFALILMLILIIAPTGRRMKEESPSTSYDTGFRVIEKLDSSSLIWIIYDKTTGVMYIMNYHGSITPIINADGTPRIWSGQ